MSSLRNDNRDHGNALVSWKEIASFLDRAERTVRRWERERGLPVHRVPGGERGGVFAYPDELADWLKGKALELEADDPTSSNPISVSVADPATQQKVVPIESVPAPALSGRRWKLSPARVAAWFVPLALTSAL